MNGIKKRNILIIEDNLYDVKDWLSSHPGGGAILKKWSGKDATIVYQTLHSHSDWARTKMKTFKIKPGPFLLKR